MNFENSVNYNRFHSIKRETISKEMTTLHAMKTKIFVILLLAATAQIAYPQETARERIEQRRQAEAARSSSTSQYNISHSEDELTYILENSRWSRIIYRYLDLSKPENSPLLLFTKIFTLLQNNEIKAYEYLDGQELFTEDYLINFTEFTERFGIQSTDIPLDEVQGYYLKEVYYFDTPTSSLRVTPLAICPIIQRFNNIEGTTRYPLFWIPYSEIAPHAKQMPVMLSPLNNSIRGTIDDFFRARRYNGEIYKTGNPGNRTLSQQTTTPEELKAEQERIEQELIDFEKRLRQQEVSQSRPTTPRSVSNTRKSNIVGTSQQTMRTRRY
jgi:gliding motility associated protien GldN